MVAQDDIINILTNLIDSDNLPHLLLYGPAGTGKTSTIQAAARRLYGTQARYKAMTLELNASDARGIDTVRNEIKEFAATQQLWQGAAKGAAAVKLIILDEADAMTSDAQFALRRIIEKYAKNARFCLICNYVSKIIPALQSRCTRFRFAPLAVEHMRDRLQDVAKAEQCQTTPDGIDAILRLSGGDMRRVLNLLQSTSMSHEMVDEAAVYLTSGAPQPADIEQILKLLMNAPFERAWRDIVELCTTRGYAAADVLQELTTRVTALDLDAVTLANLLDGLSDVEHRLAFGTDEKLQLASLVGVFCKTRDLMQVATA